MNVWTPFGCSHSVSVSLAGITSLGGVKREERGEGGTESSGYQTYIIESSIPHPKPTAQNATSRNKNGPPGEANGQPPMPIDLPLSAPQRLCQNHTPDPTCVWEPSTVYLRTGAPIGPWSIHGSRVGENHCPNWNTHTLHLGNRSASLPPSTARSNCPDLLDHESSHPPCSRACELKICRARGPVV